jgi:hypothetical protein
MSDYEYWLNVILDKAIQHKQKWRDFDIKKFMERVLQIDPHVICTYALMTTPDLNTSLRKEAHIRRYDDGKQGPPPFRPDAAFLADIRRIHEQHHAKPVGTSASTSWETKKS